MKGPKAMRRIPAIAALLVCTLGVAGAAHGSMSPTTTAFVSGAVVLGGQNDPPARIALAKAAHVGIVRVVDYIKQSSPLDNANADGPYSEHRWAKVDSFIAQAQGAGLAVELDLACYRNHLARNGLNPYDVANQPHWDRFIAWVAARVNTVTGRTYADTPLTVAVAGEPQPPVGNAPPVDRAASAQALVDFYGRETALVHQTFHAVTVSAGGFLHLNNSSINWKTIAALPSVDVLTIHVYSSNDEKILPQVAAYSAAIAKPWAVEEFGFKQTDGDSVRGVEIARVFNEARTHGAVYAMIWNLGPELIGVGGQTQTYDVNPQTPAAWAALQAAAG